MSDNKYQPPSGPPPIYPQQAHYDAGPYDLRGPASPPPQNQLVPYPQSEAYGGPAGQYGQSYNQGWGGGPPPGGYYGGPPPGGYYGGPPPGGMGYYPQQPYGYQQPIGYQQPGGYNSTPTTGIFAGLLGLMACCCCLDFLI
jgi:hypothetical protein